MRYGCYIEACQVMFGMTTVPLVAMLEETRVAMNTMEALRHLTSKEKSIDNQLISILLYLIYKLLTE